MSMHALRKSPLLDLHIAHSTIHGTVVNVFRLEWQAATLTGSTSGVELMDGSYSWDLHGRASGFAGFGATVQHS